MGGRIVSAAMGIAGLLAVASVGQADPPTMSKSAVDLGPSNVRRLSPLESASSVEGAVIDSNGSVMPVRHTSACDFDPYSYMAETQGSAPVTPLRERRTGYLDSLLPDDTPADNSHCDFECANCYGKIDIEKHLFYTYAHGNAEGDVTKNAYGDSHNGQVGLELLPWVLRDSPNFYSRWGVTTMFNYGNFQGNREIAFQSEKSGMQLTVNDGVSYGFVIGPSARADFELFHIRFSPNGMIGAAFDWTSVREIQPQGANLVFVDKFKFAGFDVGGYVRGMMDFPITQHINISVGMEYRFIPTDIMIDDGEFRKHLGFVIGLNHEF
ncbi:MAG: hypothetical protein U1D30_09410 [Planctomycetota bacterium]